MALKDRPLDQSYESYLQTLAELRRRAENNQALKFYDDSTVGSKNTECTLGLCDDKIRAMQDGIYQREGQVCPHDSRYFTVSGEKIETAKKCPMGCFYSCHIFEGTKQTRKMAVQRVMTAAAELKA